MQKKVKARRTKPTRYVCSFAERRKLAFGSDSSTFFFAHFRTSGFPSRRVGRSVLCFTQNQLRPAVRSKLRVMILRIMAEKKKGNRYAIAPIHNIIYSFNKKVVYYFNRRFDSLSSISTVIFGRSNLGEKPHSALAQESSI